MTDQKTFDILNNAFGTAAPLIFFCIFIIIILWRRIEKQDDKLEKAFRDSTQAHKGVGEALIKLSERLNKY